MLSFANQQILMALVFFIAFAITPFYFLNRSIIKFLIPFSMRDAKTHLTLNKKEVSGTISSFIVLYLCILFTAYLIENGFIDLIPLSEMPRWYLYLSVPLIVFIHDAYFYWTHRLMHQFKFLYSFHKHHHLSHDPGALSVFSFHPVEALVHFIFFPLYALIIPTSLEILQFMYLFMFICNVVGHLPYEFYPKFLYDVPILNQFNAATHHYMHHKYFNSNFSLYYNWWDRWFNTNHDRYFETFQINTNHQDQPERSPSIHLSKHSLASTSERVKKG